MKKYIMIMMVVLVGTAATAQTTTQDSYTLNGDLIEATLYHDNGIVAQTGFYTKAGKLHGEWTSFDAQGKKTAVAQYNKGSRVGTWLFYQNDTLKEVNYSNNRIASVNTYTVTDTRVVSNR